MLSDEEKQAIEYLESRLYGNEGCKIIDVAQSDLRIFLKLVENLQKDIENWKKYCDEQENDITLKNNKICDFEFKIEKQSKELDKKDKIINEYLKECYQFRAFCRRVRKDKKQDADMFNQGREYSYIQFLNLVQGEGNWSYEGNNFKKVEKELEQYTKKD